MSIIERERVTEVTTRDVLHRAADLLEEFGHCKGNMGGKDMGGFCLRGAILEAHRDLLGEELFPFCDKRVLAYVAQVGKDWYWNDAVERQPAEVVAVLREAAEASA